MTVGASIWNVRVAGAEAALQTLARAGAEAPPSIAPPSDRPAPRPRAASPRGARSQDLQCVNAYMIAFTPKA